MGLGLALRCTGSGGRPRSSPIWVWGLEVGVRVLGFGYAAAVVVVPDHHLGLSFRVGSGFLGLILGLELGLGWVALGCTGVVLKSVRSSRISGAGTGFDRHGGEALTSIAETVAAAAVSTFTHIG